MESNKSALKDNKPDGEVGLIDLTADNQDIKTKIAYLLSILESNDIDNIEAQVTALLKNMMNFFSNYVEEIPNFESLTPEQKKALLLKFRSVAQSIVGRKIKSVDELVQVFVFTVLSAIGENIASAKNISIAETINKKHKYAFKEFLKKAASYEIYKITNPNRIAGETREENFINNTVLLGVKRAMKYAGIEFDIKKLDHNSLKILKDAQINLARSQKGRGLNF